MPRWDRDTESNAPTNARRGFLARVLLATTLCGSLLGLFSSPTPVSAAGWNHFVDPSCQPDYDGQATPGINWYDQAPTTFVQYLDLYIYYYDASVGMDVVVASYIYNIFPGGGSNGDLRSYLQAYTGAGSYRGRVNYGASFNTADYSEPFNCP